MSSMPSSGGAPAAGPATTTPTPADTTTPPPANPIPDILPQATGPKGRHSAQPTASNAPPVEQLYQTAYGDYNAGKYALAATEFDDVANYYPDNNLAGNAHFYKGEILMKQNKPGLAAKEYDKVLEQYPGNSKIPASQLHKANALIAIRQTDAGIRELRSLIQRYPNSPEAVAARTRLSALGARAH